MVMWQIMRTDIEIEKGKSRPEEGRNDIVSFGMAGQEGGSERRWWLETDRKEMTRKMRARRRREHERT